MAAVIDKSIHIIQVATCIIVYQLFDRDTVMGRLSEIQERGIRRRLSMLIQHGCERESLSRQRHVSRQGQDNPRGFDALQQSGSDSSHLETFWFLGRLRH